MKYEIWVEAEINIDSYTPPHFLGTYEALDFLTACKIAIEEHGLQKEYNPKTNTVDGCELFDNEADAKLIFDEHGYIVPKVKKYGNVL